MPGKTQLTEKCVYRQSIQFSSRYPPTHCNWNYPSCLCERASSSTKSAAISSPNRKRPNSRTRSRAMKATTSVREGRIASQAMIWSSLSWINSTAVLWMCSRSSKPSSLRRKCQRLGPGRTAPRRRPPPESTIRNKSRWFPALEGRPSRSPNSHRPKKSNKVVNWQPTPNSRRTRETVCRRWRCSTGHVSDRIF